MRAEHLAHAASTETLLDDIRADVQSLLHDGVDLSPAFRCHTQRAPFYYRSAPPRVSITCSPRGGQMLSTARAPTSHRGFRAGRSTGKWPPQPERMRSHCSPANSA